MNKKFFVGIAFAVASTLGASAQVANYALSLDAGSTVECGGMPELNQKQSYTVQFWINPSQWTKGANVLRIGNAFSATLADEGGIDFKVGAAAVSAKSADLAKGKWAQVTLICDKGSTSVLVNGKNAGSGTLPAMVTGTEMCVIGGNFAGRIDEVRLWNEALISDFDYYIHTTVDRFNLQWDNMVAYYKFDQNECANIVDYKSIETPGVSHNHHGVMNGGARRELVTDNAGLPYLMNAAYTDNSRFFDRGIEKDQYLLSNDLIILGIQSYADGHLKYRSTCDHATVTNATYLEEFEGRKGVLSFNGAGAQMNAGYDLLSPEINSNGVAGKGYTFETWIYLDEWTEGAYIFKKENADGTKGFSISLGAEDTKQVVVKVDGQKFVNIKKLEVGKWMYFAVTTYQDPSVRKTFLFRFDETDAFANTTQSGTSTNYTPSDMSSYEALIGVNLKGKLDNTAVWNRKLSSDDLTSHKNSMPEPGIGKIVTAEVMFDGSGYYKYDDPTNLGWDTYSQDQWKRDMESAYEGYRGYQIRVSVCSHNGWQTTISDENKRKIFAADLAKLSEGYAGVELDLEWADQAWQYTQFGYLVDEIRAALPSDKTFMVSTHGYGAYSVPASKASKIDGFTVQQYGPGNNFFFWNNFVSSTNGMINYGFPKNKLMLSYSTTTSSGYDSNGNQAAAVIGVRNGLLDGEGYTPAEDVDKVEYNGSTFYFCGPLQTYRRAKYCVDNGMLGIFYWDMGNDVPVAHRYNIAKHCSYALNANVDRYVKEVEVKHYTASVGSVMDDVKQMQVTVAGDVLSAAVSGGEELSMVEVFALSGTKVAGAAVSGAVAELNISDLAEGAYIVVATTANGEKINQKFIK